MARVVPGSLSRRKAYERSALRTWLLVRERKYRIGQPAAERLVVAELFKEFCGDCLLGVSGDTSAEKSEMIESGVGVCIIAGGYKIKVTEMRGRCPKSFAEETAST